MCGIVGYVGTQAAAPILLEGLLKLEYRGYDSAGIAVMNGGQIRISKVTGRIANLCEKTEGGRLTPGTIGIGHTRWATHGAPTDVNAHPHLSNDGRFAVVHNGIIENYLALRAELTEKGFHFESDTDTEVIVHLLERYYAGDVKAAVIKTVSRLQGSYALGVVCADAPHTVFAAREASPLILGLSSGEQYFASDVTALVPYTRSVLYLDDGEFAALTPDGVTVFNGAGQAVDKPLQHVAWDIQAAEKDGFDHFMLKEIFEQPAAVRATLAPRIQGGRICLDEVRPDDLRDVRRIVITACGSAYYAGCAGKYAIEALCRLPVQVELASELRYSDPLMDEHTLLIVLSQSGETADTIAAMKEGKARGAKTLSIVNVVGSTVAALADRVLYTHAGPEIAVATTKGYTTQLAVLYLFALYAAHGRGTVSSAEFDRLLGELERLPHRVQNALDMNSATERLARKYRSAASVFFIGRNTDHAVALEGALKMKEISYIHAESYAAGELKHGTIALIDEHQPVVALCCNESLADKTVSNIAEVKARGAEVLAVMFKGKATLATIADELLFVPPMEPLFAPIAEIVPLQLLAYYVAKEKGCDIDKPKNLAKSVTVE